MENAIKRTFNNKEFDVPLVAAVIIKKALIEYELFSYNKDVNTLFSELQVLQAAKHRVEAYDNKRNEAYRRLEELIKEHERLGFSYAILEVIRKFDFSEESKLVYLQKLYLEIKTNPYCSFEDYIEAVEESIDILKQNKEDVPSFLQDLKNFILLNG